MFECTVIGVGYVGKYHAEKYASLSDCNLTAIVDTDLDVANRVASKYDCIALADYRDLLGKVDAVSIAVPANLHFQITRDFLNAGSHVLVEKPITETVSQANELVDLATAKSRILQVGHNERFNAVILGVDFSKLSPLFIESCRVSQFTKRESDVNVILDLMIHDIDIILDIVNSEIERIEAKGASIITDTLDFANALITFKNGCVSNLIASRVSQQKERKMSLYMPDCYISLDFQNNTIKKYAVAKRKSDTDVSELQSEEVIYEADDALLGQISHFVHCIKLNNEPIVSGKIGCRALEIALEITELITKQNCVER